MSTFTCKLGTPDGKIHTMEIDAPESEALRNSLEEKGYYVFRIRQNRFRQLFDRKGARQRVTNRSLLLLNQEMLALIKAGMPMMQVLDTILERQSAGTLTDTIRKLREDVKGGDALSTAMERHGRIFSNLYTALIRSGERTGNLAGTIQRYIYYLKKVESIRKKVAAALFYPCILVAVSLLAVGLLLFYVIPVFSQIFSDAGSQLPLLTRILIDFASLLRNFFPVFIALAIVLAFGIRSWAATDAGRYAIDRIRLKIPYLGAVFRDYSLASFSKTLANLLGSGIPIIDSLRMSIGTLNNRYLEKRFAEAAKDIEEGGRISSAFERTEIMPPLAVRLLGVGESTGALEEMLENIAEYLEELLDEQLHFITAAVEPAIMIGMGAIIGIVILAMYLPIFQLAGTVG